MPTPYLFLMFRSYLLTIAVESLVLLLGLSPVHSIPRRLFAGVWLSACTYPLLWLVLPILLPPETNRPLFLLVGETLVPLAESALFYAAFQFRRRLTPRHLLRDWLTITLANLASFAVGELLYCL